MYVELFRQHGGEGDRCVYIGDAQEDKGMFYKHRYTRVVPQEPTGCSFTFMYLKDPESLTRHFTEGMLLLKTSVLFVLWNPPGLGESGGG